MLVTENGISPFWSKALRIVLAGVCVGIGLTAGFLFQWQTDTIADRGSLFGLSGVTLTTIRGADSYSTVSGNFCDYVDQGYPESSDFSEHYPKVGTVDCPALCNALKDLGSASSVVLWVVVVGLVVWATLCIIFALGGPWSVRERNMLLGLTAAQSLFSLPPLILSIVWVSKFAAITATGMTTSTSVGCYLMFCIAILCFGVIPLAIMDILGVAGHQDLQGYRWPSRDPMQVKEEQMAAAYQQQLPEFDPGADQQHYAPPAPLGNLLRPGEVPGRGGGFTYGGTGKADRQSRHATKAAYGYGL